MDYYIAVKINELDITLTTFTTLENVLSEKKNNFLNVI